MARLIVESGGERREYRVFGPLTIGRQKTNQVVLEDKLLSREHTRIEIERTAAGARFTVRDLGSKNGTFLNGQFLKYPEALKDGDQIKIGPFVLRFVLDPEDKGTSARPAPAPAPPAPARAAVNVPPPKPAVARPRPPREEEPAPSAAFGFVYTLFLLAVLAAGTFVSKLVFVWAFQKALPE